MANETRSRDFNRLIRSPPAPAIINTSPLAVALAFSFAAWKFDASLANG
eukprot:CAMPEP_0171303540 /NCGR_PEP_ID=MMETSP0816-20121228/13070_1 /TAXON_ID=420281 /ORGANISM="Proboscia inermis, Strain CCAP1064/1" /LENGTH=48 /DNA_ID= /DNA_START= /DNA_END= /DNA_ORIENTATION=